MKQVRPNGTTRARKGVESQTCYRCNEVKDITCYHAYWYQPRLGGKPKGDKVRRRYKACKSCAVKKIV